MVPADRLDESICRCPVGLPMALFLSVDDLRSTSACVAVDGCVLAQHHVVSLFVMANSVVRLWFHRVSVWLERQADVLVPARLMLWFGVGILGWGLLMARPILFR